MKRKLINISNHPSTEWADTQLKMAYGIAEEIIDIPFPAVDPAVSDTNLRQLCSDIVSLVELHFDGNADHILIHVMGEMRLTFMLVAKLQAKGYRCYASAGQRDVSILDDGSMVRKFHFHGFREYPRLDCANL
jgi:hypothetical protein